MISKPFLVPFPECKVASSDCTQLWDEFTSWNTIQNMGRGYLEDNTPQPTGAEPHLPFCSTDQSGTCWTCGFSEATVNFLHWAAYTDESHLCANHDANNTYVVVPSGTPAQIMTARWKEFTLTSPTAYAYFPTMKHDFGCGAIHTNILLPVRPDDVSTLIMRPIASSPGVFEPMEASKLDYRHLAYTKIGSLSVPLVPHSAYFGDEKCGYLGDECKTVYHDYQPGILYRAYPGALRSIDPAWKACSNQQFAAFDPPIVLTPMPLELPKVTMPRIAASPTVVVEPLPLHTLLQQNAVGNDPRPGATQEGPYAAQTDQAAPMRLSGSTKVAPNAEPGVMVSKISVLTVFASLATIQGSGPDGTIAKHDAHHGASAVSAMGSKLPKDGLSPHGSVVGNSFQGDTAPAQSSPEGSSPKKDSKRQQKEAIFTQSGKAHTAHQLVPGTFVVEGSTISAGGAPITIDGAIVSAIDSGLVLQSAALGSHSGSSFSSFDGVGGKLEDEEEYTKGPLGAATTKGKKSGAMLAVQGPWSLGSFNVMSGWMGLMCICIVLGIF
jgi:hypothetical protein